MEKLDSAWLNDFSEPEWFHEGRTQSLNEIDQLNWPRFEKINYSNWHLADAHAPKTTDLNVQSITLPITDSKSTARITQIGNRTVDVQLPENLKQQGVLLLDLKDAIKDFPKLIEKYFMQYAVKANRDQLSALHRILVSGGIFLYIPKHVHIKEPIESYLYQDNRQENTDYFNHVLVVADEDSSVSYVENRFSLGDKSNLANVIVEVFGGENSQIRFASVDQWHQNVRGYLNRSAYLTDGSHIQWAIGAMNDGLILNDISTELVGRGSQAKANVVSIATGDQYQAINTRLTNIGQKTVGHILQHGVILEQANLVFNGIGHILKGAKGSDAQQESRVLMLSNDARGDANPILLIDENDVTAGHAASVGKVDQRQMYYLMSRGIDYETAQRLVIRGFLGSVIGAIPSKEIRQTLTETIERKLINGQKVNRN